MNEYQGKGGLNAIMEISSLSVQVVLCVCVSGARYQPSTTNACAQNSFGSQARRCQVTKVFAFMR